MRAHVVTADFGVEIRDAEDTDFAHPINGVVEQQHRPDHDAAPTARKVALLREERRDC
jgi:hypothetical protein